jgi:hypothetical protein
VENVDENAEEDERYGMHVVQVGRFVSTTHALPLPLLGLPLFIPELILAHDGRCQPPTGLDGSRWWWVFRNQSPPIRPMMAVRQELLSQRWHIGQSALWDGNRKQIMGNWRPLSHPLFCLLSRSKPRVRLCSRLHRFGRFCTRSQKDSLPLSI